MASWKNFLSPFLIILIIIIGSISGFVSTDEELESKDFVVTLDHSNFTDFVANHKFIVVEFYDPGCEKCKKFAPEYEKAAAVLSKTDPLIVLAKVDAVDKQNQFIVGKYKMFDFPAVKILRHGGSVVQEYRGPKEADGIVDYVIKQSGPASVEIKSSEESTSVIDDYKILVVGIFPEFSGEKFENFTIVAEKLRGDYEFGHTSNAKLLPHGDSSVTGPLIRLLKPFDEHFVDFQEFNMDILEKFVHESSIPSVTLYLNDPKYSPFVYKFFRSLHPKVMLFVSFGSEQIDAFKTKYQEVARLYEGKEIGFTLVDADTKDSKTLLEYFGPKGEQLPLLFIQVDNDRKFLLPNTKLHQIESWVKDFKDGILQPYLKSAPIPEVNNEPVKVVVSDSLQDMVLNSKKNVLLEFYAPWCPHCVELAPTLVKVARSFENDDDVLIAKFDAMENDVPRDIFDVKGYPTVYFRSSTGELLVYEGDRSKEDLIDFINKNRATVAKQEFVKDEL